MSFAFTSPQDGSSQNLVSKADNNIDSGIETKAQELNSTDRPINQITGVKRGLSERYWLNTIVRDNSHINPNANNRISQLTNFQIANINHLFNI